MLALLRLLHLHAAPVYATDCHPPEGTAFERPQQQLVSKANAAAHHSAAVDCTRARRGRRCEGGDGMCCTPDFAGWRSTGLQTIHDWVTRCQAGQQGSSSSLEKGQHPHRPDLPVPTSATSKLLSI